MLAKTDVTRIYETVLSIPGMNDNVKIALNIPRKNVLFLCKAIERGISAKDTEEKSNSVLDIVPKETLQEFSDGAVMIEYCEINQVPALSEPVIVPAV